MYNGSGCYLTADLIFVTIDVIQTFFMLWRNYSEIEDGKYLVPPILICFYSCLILKVIEANELIEAAGCKIVKNILKNYVCCCLSSTVIEGKKLTSTVFYTLKASKKNNFFLSFPFF